MKAVLFSKINAIEKLEVRLSLVRIPEVISNIKKAQKVLEEMGLVDVDLMNDMTSVKPMSKEVRNLLLSAVQLGLFSRYVRQQGQPDFFACLSYNEAPISICLGRSTFENLVLDSGLFKSQTVLKFPNRIDSQEILDFDPFLFSNLNLEKYGIYHLNGYGNRKLVFESQSSDKIVEKLIKKYEVKQFVNIGTEDLMLDTNQYSQNDIQVINSIDADPMLQWYWGSVQELKSVSGV